MAAIGDLVANISLNNSGLKKGAQESRGIVSSLGGAITSSLGMISGLVGGLSIVGGLTWGASLAAQAEQSQISFEVMLGSADRATQMLADLQSYSDVSPFGGDTVRASAQQLMNYGVAADDIIPTIRMLGDVAAGDEEKMKSLGTAFGQVSATGRLMGGDLNQFINAGFNPLQEIAAQTGESMVDLKKRMEAGGVSVGEVRGAFVRATSEGGRFFGMTERQAGTISGKFSTMKDGVANAMRSVSQTIMEGLDVSGALDTLNSAISQIPFYFKNAGSLIQIEIIGWQLYFDQLIPGTAQTMQDIGIIFQAAWAGMTAFFTNFIDTIKGGLAEIKNLAEATVAGVNAQMGNERTWGQFAKDVFNRGLVEVAQNNDTINAMLGGSDTFTQDLFGLKPWQKPDEPLAAGQAAFNNVLANQADVAPPGEDAFTAAGNAFKNTLAELVGNGGQAGGMAEQLAQQRANLMMDLAEQGDQTGYGSAGNDKKNAEKGAEADAKAKSITDKEGANARLALKGSSDAASIMTRGVSSPMKRLEETSLTQLKIQQMMLAQLKENERAAMFNMPISLANF